MNGEFVLFLGKRALETALLLSAPALAVALLVGFVTALFQAVTSIRDMTLGVVVKIAAVGFTLLLTGGWMMQLSLGFTNEIFNHMQSIAP